MLQGGSLTNPAVSLELSDDTAVGQGVLFDVPGTTTTTMGAVADPIGAISNAFGVLEGAPVWWIAVSVGPDVASAQMTLADGSTDEMSPVDGVAVLAHHINPSMASAGDGPYEVRGTLQLLDSSGAVINIVTFPEPTPPPMPLPVPVPGAPLASVPGSTPSTSIATQTSPPASDGPMTACPEMMDPAKASDG